MWLVHVYEIDIIKHEIDIIEHEIDIIVSYNTNSYSELVYLTLLNTVYTDITYKWYYAYNYSKYGSGRPPLRKQMLLAWKPPW